MPKDFTGVDS